MTLNRFHSIAVASVTLSVAFSPAQAADPERIGLELCVTTLVHSANYYAGYENPLIAFARNSPVGTGAVAGALAGATVGAVPGAVANARDRAARNEQLHRANQGNFDRLKELAQTANLIGEVDALDRKALTATNAVQRQWRALEQLATEPGVDVRAELRAVSHDGLTPEREARLRAELERISNSRLRQRYASALAAMTEYLESKRKLRERTQALRLTIDSAFGGYSSLNLDDPGHRGRLRERVAKSVESLPDPETERSGNQRDREVDRVFQRRRLGRFAMAGGVLGAGAGALAGFVYEGYAKPALFRRQCLQADESASDQELEGLMLIASASALNGCELQRQVKKIGPGQAQEICQRSPMAGAIAARLVVAEQERRAKLAQDAASFPEASCAPGGGVERLTLARGQTISTVARAAAGGLRGQVTGDEPFTWSGPTLSGEDYPTDATVSFLPGLAGPGVNNNNLRPSRLIERFAYSSVRNPNELPANDRKEFLAGEMLAWSRQLTLWNVCPAPNGAGSQPSTVGR